MNVIKKNIIMKKIRIYMMSIVSIMILCTSCEDNEVIYDPLTGPTGIGLTVSSVSVVVPEEGVTINIKVQSTTVSSSAREFSLARDEASTGSPQDYSLTSLSIPANSHEGSFDITFGNFDNLEDLVTFKLILNLDLADDVGVTGFDSVTFNYVKKLVCNDFTLTLIEDFYSDERTWDVTDDASGAVVASGGPYPQTTGGSTIVEEFTLPDGCYTFGIYDAFGDGQFDGNISGGYTLKCSVLDIASGAGNWGFDDIHNFISGNVDIEDCGF
jgi:hypothetical protein